MLEQAAVREYEGALASVAPWAYARIFAASGSFREAQDALEGALGASFAAFDDLRRLVGGTEAGRALVPIVVKLAAARLETREPPGPASAFSRAPKLRAQEEVLALVRSFSEPEQAAIVLLHVEEVPDAKVREWLGVDERFLEDLRARLDERVRALTPPTAADAGGKELFERTLRQHRLPSSFPRTVMARVGAAGPAGSAAPRPVVAAWILPLGLLALCLVSASFSRAHRTYPLGMGYQYGGGGLLPLFLASPVETNVLVVALLILRRHLSRPETAAAMPQSALWLRPASLALATLGAPFVVMMLSPMTAEMVAAAFPGVEVFLLAQNVWRLGSVACLGVGLYWILLGRSEKKP